jgi:hypothetical protein
MTKGRLGRPAFTNHPAAKLLDGLQVEVERLGADAALRIPESDKIVLDLGGVDVAPVLEATVLDDGAEPAGKKRHMPLGAALGFEGLCEVALVLLQSDSRRTSP